MTHHISPPTHEHAPGLPLAAQLASLNTRFEDAPAQDVLRHALTQMGNVALVSSFGADSVVLLHMAAQIDRDVPVLFIDTELLFAETLSYQQELTQTLGLTGVIALRAGETRRADPDNSLHTRDTDACCNLRKTRPLNTALRGFDGWISGRKRYQSGTRAHLPLFEADPDSPPRIKVNPLAAWDALQLRDYMNLHALPRHPLVAQGYPSLGCAPCTSKVARGEPVRAGRWRGDQKEECGIHFVNGRPQRRGAST